MKLNSLTMTETVHKMKLCIKLSIILVLNCAIQSVFISVDNIHTYHNFINNYGILT